MQPVEGTPYCLLIEGLLVRGEVGLDQLIGRLYSYLLYYLLLFLPNILDDRLLAFPPSPECLLKLSVLIADLPGLLLLQGLPQLVKLCYQARPLLTGQVLRGIKLHLQVSLPLLVLGGETVLGLPNVSNQLLNLRLLIFTDQLQLLAVCLDLFVEGCVLLDLLRGARPDYSPAHQVSTGSWILHKCLKSLVLVLHRFDELPDAVHLLLEKGLLLISSSVLYLLPLSATLLCFQLPLLPTGRELHLEFAGLLLLLSEHLLLHLLYELGIVSQEVPQLLLVLICRLPAVP